MPLNDGTGPEGKGERTGRGKGTCPPKPISQRLADLAQRGK